jgi:asparagine synthase (glutamine-hydrolysing)
MSAICGIFYLDGRPVLKEISQAMLKKFSMYPSDQVAAWQKDSVFLGCHAQRVTPQSINETLPLADESTGLVITADAIIDNRDELFALFKIPLQEQDSIPDSRLILLAYSNWGQACPQFLCGDFAFAIWDGRRQELFCARDHMGKRTFYYHYAPGLFAFSTLMRPLFFSGETEQKLNDLWLADFLAIPFVSHDADPEQTVYKYIMQIPPAHTLMVRPGRIEKHCFWRPGRQDELRLSSDSEYEEAWREVFFEAVRCRLRSNRPVGVMMSGGLDSTAVACAAAQELKKSGKRLQAYSAVPMEGFKNWLSPRGLADETPYIDAVKEHIGNIDVTYCQSPGKHPLSDNERFLDMLEQPYKIFENLFWLDSLAGVASQQGCGVLLDGQSGNSTISLGSFSPYALGLFRQGSWRLLRQEIQEYCRRQNRSLLRVSLKTVIMALPASIQIQIAKRRGRKDYLGMLSPINPEFAERMKVRERFRNAGYDFMTPKLVDLATMRHLVLHPAVGTHLGAVESKLSLTHNLAKRDPTRDKRVVDFCLRVPLRQYVRDGVERSLIRRAMVGLLPDQIRLNTTVQGVQSADWAQRLMPAWENIKNELASLLRQEQVRPYLDISRLEAALAARPVIKPADAADPELRMLLRSFIFGKFLQAINLKNLQGGEHLSAREKTMDKAYTAPSRSGEDCELSSSQQ